MEEEYETEIATSPDEEVRGDFAFTTNLIVSVEKAAKILTFRLFSFLFVFSQCVICISAKVSFGKTLFDIF